MTTKKTAVPKSDSPAPAGGTMPLFYGKPVLLDYDQHAGLGLAGNQTFAFAGSANALPVNLIEFPQVAHYYPIAFARDAFATPVAVVGVRDNENLFVGANGEWQANTYVPSYIRRYPFILSESADGKNLSLCIEDAPGILAKDGEKFFDDQKQPTQMAKNAMEFCRSYHLAARQTQDFGKALADSGLLVDRSADLTIKGGQRVSFSGFRIIDEEKFNRLPEKTLAEWRNKGWLGGVYAHLFSGLNWGVIARMLAERAEGAKGK